MTLNYISIIVLILTGGVHVLLSSELEPPISTDSHHQIHHTQISSRQAGRKSSFLFIKASLTRIKSSLADNNRQEAINTCLELLSAIKRLSELAPSAYQVRLLDRLANQADILLHEIEKGGLEIDSYILSLKLSINLYQKSIH